jgi:WD40-like Beta Propeller Repeat
VNARRLLCSLFVVVAGVLVFASAPALAAPLEAPELKVESITATSATLHGVLNPKTVSGAGTYEFLYKQGKAGCTGGTKVPVPPGLMTGAIAEPAYEGISGLVQGTEYTACLRAVNTTIVPNEEASSAAVTFTTATPPEAPETLAKEATTTTVKLEGTLNPKTEAVTGYYFAYATAAKCTEGSTTAPVAPAKLKAGSKVPATTVSGLEPSRKYVVCLVASNEAGEIAVGNEVPFTTLASKPSVEAESVSGVKGTEAHLEGVVNPNNQASECKLEYGTEPVLAKGTVVLCEPAAFPSGYGGQAVARTVAGLSANTTYYYRVLASNASGVEEGTIEHFSTAIPPETPEAGKAEPLASTSTTLHGVLNPAAKGEAGSYQFLYNAGASECTNGIKVPEPAGEAKGVQKEAVQAAITGLYPGSAYTFCVLQTNSVGETAQSAPVTFTTPIAPPAILGESVSSVESSDATLEARISPDGAETKYHFEYGTSEAYGQSTPEATIEGLTGTSTVRARVTGLTPNTLYHYRVSASNEIAGKHETSPGPDETLRTPVAPGSGAASSCPNELLRAEQPYGLGLPDCRAYEQVSPVESEGQDATDPEDKAFNRAALSGDAITYGSRGNFADPAGGAYENQFLSRRGPDGWSTQGITPPAEAYVTRTEEDFRGMAFTPELTEGVTRTSGSLTSEAPRGLEEMYLADFANDTYQWLMSNVPDGERPFEPQEQNNVVLMGSSTDLSHVVYVVPNGPRYANNTGTVYEWVNGKVVTVDVANDGEVMNAAVGSRTPNETGEGLQFGGGSVWRAVSSDGSRVFLTSYGNGRQVYVRENVEQPQSLTVFPVVSGGTGELASGAAAGVGDLTSGSSTVGSLVTAAGEATLTSGSEEITSVVTSSGEFMDGQPVSGTGIEPGTTIMNVSGSTLKLSAPVTASGNKVSISTDGPAPFVVGQEIEGSGIPSGTTITAVAPGDLTLSNAATASGGKVALRAGGECTVSGDACTVDVSASQRKELDPNGYVPEQIGVPRPATYLSANADGSRVFFTSSVELTENAYTGPDDNAENLYEYTVETGKLTDLTVDASDPDGAAVQGAVQISEDGSYVYFVADGDLGGGALAGEPNLYVVHDDGAPTFIATLTAQDLDDWFVGLGDFAEAAGVGVGQTATTAAVTPDGTRLAFQSYRELTGYDTRDAKSGEPDDEIYLYDTVTKQLECASCNPSGARPVGSSSLTYTPVGGIQEYRSRDLSEDGVLFFDSDDALVPHASDGLENVYEYEDGHVYPISNVAGGYPSFFLDASPNGENVFFATADQLLPQDVSNNVVVYDARVGGGFPISAAAPTCNNGDSCKPPPTPVPALFGAPGSATFSGAGNIAPETVKPAAVKTKSSGAKCKKGFVKKNDKCVRKKPKKSAKKKAKKSNDRKGSR